MFAIIAVSDPVKLHDAIVEHYPDDHLLVAPGEWLIASDSTAQDVSKILGITEGDSGSGIVLSFQTYYGRKSPQIWEWIADKMGAKRG
jgi:hypothetical protein